MNDDEKIHDKKGIYSAVIIEFRCHRAMTYVLTNFLENLSEEWNIIIFHGNLNYSFIKKIIYTKLKQYKYRIKLHHLPFDNLWAYEYSGMLIRDTSIYDKIDTETFMIFQTDTVILPSNKDLINNFLQYDYVGAPWGTGSVNDVGNGGLSLRKKSKMLEIIEKEDEERKNEPEDVFFSRSTKVNLFKPEPEEAGAFAIENTHCNENPFGVHKPWGDPNNGIESRFCQMHPEIIELYELNKKLD